MTSPAPSLRVRLDEPDQPDAPAQAVEPDAAGEANDPGVPDRPGERDEPEQPIDLGEPAIERALWALLDRRAAEATVCPSEVARSLAPDVSAWRGLMPKVRAVAKRLADAGALRVTRHGVEVIDAAAGGGPIRLGRTGKPGETGR